MSQLWTPIVRRCLISVVAVAATVAAAGAVDSPAQRFDAMTGAAAAPANCSKQAATEVVKRLRLTAPEVTNPVFKVLCGSFTGPGSQTMVASLLGPVNVGMLHWVVFHWADGDWQLVLKRRQAAVLTAAGSGIRETVQIYRPGDPRCCPSGGTKSRIWRWNGSRLVASPWRQATPGKAVTAEIFRSPSTNIECQIEDRGGSAAFAECWTFRPPQKARLFASGRLTICRGSEARCRLGNLGLDARTLRYGRQVTVGRFRCASLQSGIRCTVVRTGEGFLINRSGVLRVGR